MRAQHDLSVLIISTMSLERIQAYRKSGIQTVQHGFAASRTKNSKGAVIELLVSNSSSTVKKNLHKGRDRT